MNRTYKVIWSKARRCYVVVSELTKGQHKLSSKSEHISSNVHRGGGYFGKAAAAAVVASLLTFGSLAYSPVMAAEKDIVDKGAQQIAYDISPANDGTNIAVGKNAKVFIGGGTQEAMLSFGEKVTVYNFGLSMHIHDNDHAKKNLPEGMAVGTNSYARTGSIEIGAHTLAENKISIGDTTADKLQQFGVASTTLGTNSYTGGGFATTIGSYNAQSNPYAANGFMDTLNNATKNAFATVIGTFNSNESMTGGSTSGVANMIAGTANKVTNSNGAIVMGAGNSVKNSSAYFDATAYSTHFDSVTEMQKALMDGVASSAGGATLVIGGANQAENTSHSQIMGVGNSMKSTTYTKVQYNYLDGFDSHITDASHVKVLGQKVTINKGADSNTVIGDNRTVAEDQTNNVIIGNADEKKPITTKKKETVILGYDANATVDGGVAIGSGSVASVDKASTDANAIGYDPATKKASTDTSSTWKSTAAAVSIGDASKNITRQITNLAAGAQDTDAVNVAQLKAAQTHFYSVNSTDETAGNYNNDGAKGKNSLAAGVGALANGSNSVAIGTNAKAQNDALAVGENASAGNTGIAIGMRANAGYGQNMALGYYASVANGVRNSTALGYSSQVTKRDILPSDGLDGVISVGKSVGQSGEAGMTRRIINVRAGIKATDAANVSQLTELKEGEHISITDSATPNEKGQTVKTISVKVDGQIAKGNTGILSGDTVYKEVHVDKNGNYIKSGYTVAENLNALDGKVKTNADNIEKNGQAIEKNSARIDTNAKNIEKNSQAIEKNSARIDTNAKNIEKNSQAIEKNSARIDTNAKNIEKNSQAIEKNSARIDTNAKNIEKNSQAIEKTSALVQTNAQNIEKNGEAIEKNSARIDTNSKNIEILQKTKADTNLSNITDAGKTVINNIAKKSVKVEAGSSNVSVTKNDVADGPITYTVDVAKDLNINSITAKMVTSDTTKTKELSVSETASIGDVTINKGNQGTVNGLKNTTWDSTKITHGQAATEDQLQAATKNAVNYDGDNSKTVTLREDTTIKNVADTTIEQGSKNAVNAGTIYNETRVAKDGTFVKQANTAGENLSALDNQVTANTESIYHMNGRISDLDNRVNKVGAGAAALAALHPLDFDPDDKWDFAVGYGNYRNANSVAFGAFYRPNEDTMFSLGTNFGNGENMFNAGLSFKIGQGSGITTSKTAMAKKIESLEDTVDKQDKKIAELEALVKEQGEMIRQYVGKK